MYRSIWNHHLSGSISAISSTQVMRRDGGRHEITVNLPEIEPEISSLFFTLSAYSCGDISLFRNPSIRFFDAFDSSKLAEYTAESHPGSQAVVLAHLRRNPTVKDTWRVLLRWFLDLCIFVHHSACFMSSFVIDELISFLFI